MRTLIILATLFAHQSLLFGEELTLNKLVVKHQGEEYQAVGTYSGVPQGKHVDPQTAFLRTLGRQPRESMSYVAVDTGGNLSVILEVSQRASLPEVQIKRQAAAGAVARYEVTFSNRRAAAAYSQRVVDALMHLVAAEHPGTPNLQGHVLQGRGRTRALVFVAGARH